MPDGFSPTPHRWDGYSHELEPEVREAAVARLHSFMAAAAALTRDDLSALSGTQMITLANTIQAKRAEWDNAVCIRPGLRRVRPGAFWPSRAPGWPARGS